MPIKIISKKLLKITINIFIISNSLVAQVYQNTEWDRGKAIAKKLQEEGFQNIDIYSEGTSYLIAYENRVYRFEALALKKVLQLTTESLGNDLKLINSLTFITKRNNIPMLQTSWRINRETEYNYFQNVLISRKIRPLKTSSLVVEAKNPGSFKAELIIQPHLSVELGNLYLEDQFIHLIDLRPKLNLYLWKGAHFSYEFIVPISNEFKTQAPHWGKLRPRVVSLTQQFRLPSETFLNTSVGLFSRNRYGISTQIGRYFLNDKLQLTAELGYTGHASYIRYNGFEVNKGWLYTDLNYVDYKIGVSYWFPKYNLQVGMEYGKVLFNRKAMFFQVRQKFRELDLELYAYRTDQGNNFGFELGLPLFPKKYWKPGLLSVRPAKKFTYTYLSGRRSGGNINLAREYQAQGMFPDFPQDLNPHFMKNYLNN